MAYTAVLCNNYILPISIKVCAHELQSQSEPQNALIPVEYCQKVCSEVNNFMTI